jgi:toxin CptA
LLAGYLALLALALLAVWLAAIPLWASLTASLLCWVHAFWVLPRFILLNRQDCFVGLRHSPSGWELQQLDGQWQSVQLCRDSLALPVAVILRFRLPSQRFARGLCIPADAMDASAHRRLRVRLKFSRNRWAAAE